MSKKKKTSKQEKDQSGDGKHMKDMIPKMMKAAKKMNKSMMK